jgi:HisJ family histidinol phosphate phosphatase
MVDPGHQTICGGKKGNMPFSHHSHSGQFCPGHAKNSLEEIIQKAIEQKMQLFCLTEHMPRAEEDFYPEEVMPTSCCWRLSKLLNS